MRAADTFTQDALARAAAGAVLSRDLLTPADGDLSFVHSPAGDQLDWSALSPEEVLCLAEKPMRIFLAGEGGTGKTHVVSNLVLNGAFRLFLGKFCDAQPLAFTNRAAGLYGAGANTVMGYMGVRPEPPGRRSSGGGPGARRSCGPLRGAGAEPGARAVREEKMRGTECYVIDEASQLDGALFDDMNRGVFDARAPRDRMTRCDALSTHYVHPFAMARLVAVAGDWAQLAYPQSEPLCKWPKLFRRMPAPKHSNRALEELAGR
eukprot:gene53942-49883_t